MPRWAESGQLREVSVDPRDVGQDSALFVTVHYEEATGEPNLSLPGPVLCVPWKPLPDPYFYH